MSGFLGIAVVVALVAVVGVLLAGVVTMGRGGKDGAVRSNKLMRWRIGLQLLAVMLFVLLLLSQGA